ncbi:MAG: hypothetical protein LBS53_04205 [Synergistaceae bacterium]|jgi:hypothetical protein|nr:hypothetical protein [Synergistaceae bacterium]
MKNGIGAWFLRVALAAAVMAADTGCLSAFAAQRAGAVSDDKPGLKDREYYRSLPVMERLLSIAEDYAEEMGISPEPDEMQRPGGPGRPRGDEDRRRPGGGRRRPERPRHESPPRRRDRGHDSCGTGAGAGMGIMVLPVALALIGGRKTKKDD